MMEHIMERMSKEEKQRLMDEMIERFFADLTPDYKNRG